MSMDLIISPFHELVPIVVTGSENADEVIICRVLFLIQGDFFFSSLDLMIQ